MYLPQWIAGASKPNNVSGSPCIPLHSCCPSLAILSAELSGWGAQCLPACLTAESQCPRIPSRIPLRPLRYYPFVLEAPGLTLTCPREVTPPLLFKPTSQAWSSLRDGSQPNLAQRLFWGAACLPRAIIWHPHGSSWNWGGISVPASASRGQCRNTQRRPFLPRAIWSPLPMTMKVSWAVPQNLWSAGFFSYPVFLSS